MTPLSPRLQLALEGEIREAYLKGIETGRKLAKEKLREEIVGKLEAGSYISYDISGDAIELQRALAIVNDTLSTNTKGR